MSEWRTSVGKGEDAWVNIQLHSSISIHKIEVLQPEDGAFKKINIMFSNGQDRSMDLGSEPYLWYAADFAPPINTTSLNITALQHYNPLQLANWFYRIIEISINGDRGGTGKYCNLLLAQFMYQLPILNYFHLISTCNFA